MSITVLLAKLIEVERSIGVDSETILRKKLYEVEDYALQIQKELVELLCKRSTHPVPNLLVLGGTLRGSSE
jgi:hypothetical protein